MGAKTTDHVGLPGVLRRSGYLQGMFILVVLLCGAMGWGWLMHVTVERIDVRQAHYTDPEEVREIADVDSGDVLFDISPRLVADRVARLPWVRKAGVTRLPTGKLLISLREREPVALALGTDGRETFYLDRDGYQMPAVDGASFDVPLVSGYPESFHPVKPTDDSLVLQVLDALDREAEGAGILISEVLLRDGECWLQLEPTGERGSTPVRLGRDEIRDKLVRLTAFWNQRVLPGQDSRFDLIDLRFSSRIITQEENRD